MKARTVLLLVTTALLLPGAAPAQIVEYYSLDAIGSVRVVTDQQGRVIERHDYLPFGEECTTGSCASNPGMGAGQSRKFTAKERDDPKGLDYFEARYYGAMLGRFSSVDPVNTRQANLVDPQRWNRYAYGRNNPTRFVDPDGRVAIEIPSGRLAQNAAIRASLAEFFGSGSPSQHPHARFGGGVADTALATVLPANAEEYRASVEASMFAFATPMSVGLAPGQAGRFASLDARAVVGDQLTPHHIPQAAAGFTSRSEGAALVMQHGEHLQTRTYGAAGRAVARQEAGLPLRDVLARDIRDVRRIVRTKYNEGLRAVVDYYREHFPDLLKK